MPGVAVTAVVVTAAVVTAAVVTAVLVVVMPVLVAVMPVLVAVISAAVISVAADGVTADGMEEVATGEDVAITRTDGTAIPTILMAGIGRLSVILTARATGSGFPTIEGKGELRTCVRLTRPARSLPYSRQARRLIRPPSMRPSHSARRLMPGLSSYRYKGRVLPRVSRGISYR